MGLGLGLGFVGRGVSAGQRLREWVYFDRPASISQNVDIELLWQLVRGEY